MADDKLVFIKSHKMALDKEKARLFGLAPTSVQSNLWDNVSNSRYSALIHTSYIHARRSDFKTQETLLEVRVCGTLPQ